jgi:hypothetical protein
MLTQLQGFFIVLVVSVFTINMLICISSGSISNSCDLNLWNFQQQGYWFFRTFGKIKNNLIYAKVAPILR